MKTQTRATLSAKLLLTALVLTSAGCGADDPFGASGGRVRFVLSSDAAAPVSPGLAASPSLDGDRGGNRNPYFESANVTFSSILARSLDGVLVNVGMDLPTTLDVVTMENGRTIPLPDGALEPATYDQIVVVMTAVQGVTRDSTTVTLEAPGGGWTVIVPICPFTVEAGATAVVGLTLNVRNSFLRSGNRYHFQPRFACETAAQPAG